MVHVADTKKKKPESSAKAIAARLEDARFRTELLQLAGRLLIIALAAWIMFSKVLLITQAKGQNMFPSVKDGDLVIAFRMQKEYAKGDIVVCTVNGERYVGRIAANQTDNVGMDESGALSVNGTVQSGEIIYPTFARGPLEYPFHVPEGCVFLLGDYRTGAEDSRDFGPVPYSQVEGKVITILRRREL